MSRYQEQRSAQINLCLFIYRAKLREGGWGEETEARTRASSKADSVHRGNGSDRMTDINAQTPPEKNPASTL